MRSTIVLSIVLTWVLGSTCRAAADTDASGRITGMTAAGELVDVVVRISIPTRGWSKQTSLADARDVKRQRDGTRQLWSGRVEVAPGHWYRLEEAIDQTGDGVTLEAKVVAEAEADIEGVFLFVSVPREGFAGGHAGLTNGDAPAGEAGLPREPPPQRHFLNGQADRAVLSAPGGSKALQVVLGRALPVTVQDSREWRGTTYDLFTPFARALKAGEEATLNVTLRLDVQPDQTPAVLTVDPGTRRYRLDGFGGNYCFGIESPVTQYTLANLRVAWARTEMTLTEWEPKNDNDSPEATDWSVLAAQDKPESNLHREFLLAKQIQEKGIPTVISIWDLPPWLYEDEGKLPRDRPHRIHPERWPELLESIGSYLDYARRTYAVEPDLFCFNEANLGVRVLLTAEEHRDAIKRLGAHFRKLGLKTRLLLADATGPRGTHVYALPAAADPDALPYVGALAFHSWGGGSAQDYQAWGDLAERLKLPLLVTELGVDAGAWRTAAFDSFSYALREVRMYQELLLYARPQGTMQWEFTSDYSIVKVAKDAAGQVQIQPGVRFFFVRQFCNLTPGPADALTTTSDHAKVLVTAFRGTVTPSALTVHIANLGATRPASLTGLPRSVTTLNVVCTGEAAPYRVLAPVAVGAEPVRLELPAQSLLTLTTLPPDR